MPVRNPGCPGFFLWWHDRPAVGIYSVMDMNVAVALFAFAFATGNATGQTALRSDAGIERLDVAQNLDPGSLAQQSENLETRVLVLSPKASTRPGETHAALVLSNTNFVENFTFRGRVQTVKQLRTGSPPNPWECAWIVWNYQGNHFYYLALKTNGWEIGKYDRAFKAQQKFLRTGKTPYAVGVWHEFEIAQKQDEITVRLDDEEIATFRDEARPYTSGKLGFYTEDAEIQIDDITAPFNDDFEDYPLQVQLGDGRVVKNWFMPFLGHGYAAIMSRKK
jgi:hypothetical protein